MAGMTEEQWQAVYDAAYAASDAWQKERKDLIAERDRALNELAGYMASRDYWKNLYETLCEDYKAPTVSTEDLIRSGESRRSSHQMKIKVSEITTAQLDWAVAKCEGGVQSPKELTDDERYSTEWSIGGPIIERNRIELAINLDGD